MKTKINFYLIEYALNSLFRQKYKNLFILFILTLQMVLLFSIFFISNSIKYELNSTVKSLPQITIQKLKAGRHYDIDKSLVDEILNIPGVQSALPRVWGYYYFENAGVNFSVVGIDEFEEQYKKSLEKLIEKHDFSEALKNSSMIIGTGVKKILDENYYKQYFNFIKPDGSFKKVNILGVFDSNIQLEANDTILLPIALAQEIFDMPKDKATDIVVKVANENEIETIAAKLKLMYPDSRIITNKDLEVSYQNIFDYKGGIFLALFIVSIFTFFIIVYDKSNSLNSQEKKEIGILKALGWQIDDILKLKFYESFIISFISFILSLFLALIFVYILQAPILKDIFTGYSNLKPILQLPFVFDINSVFLIFFITVPVYIAATIIPAWKTATMEADKVIR